jgi:NTP pyrophosphatase (non-canonical NTP hydrolase)
MKTELCPVSTPTIEGIDRTLQEFARYQRQAFGERTPQFFALELAGECGELCNLEKKIWRAGPDSSSEDLHGKLADEAADVFIALMNYSHTRKIDLESAVREKLARIEARRLSGAIPRSTEAQD